MIYCDYAATTPMSEKALDAYQQVARSYYGNASSLHDAGAKAGNLLSQARQSIAAHLRVPHDSIVFTSGGTESNCLAIDTLLRSIQKEGVKHIISTSFEHSSLFDYLQSLQQQDQYDVTFLSGNEHGVIELSELQEAIQSNTALVTIQHVNSETGVMQPIENIATFLQSQSILFHSDCVQSFGKIDIVLDTMPIDAISFSGHKIFGPKGVGGIYFHPRLRLAPHPVQTNHEFGLRPGTVDVSGIFSFAVAVDDMFHKQKDTFAHLCQLRNSFHQQLRDKQLPIKPIVNGDSHICPSIIGCEADYLQGDYIMLEYNRYGIFVSTGSACSIGNHETPRSLQAIGKTNEESKRYVRFSFSHLTHTRDIADIISVTETIFSSNERSRIYE
ncbi:cysteine desulfurase [Gracilibacillus halophilus YIM-C55.5]|uniref:Cysteine desulfurase n=1 Tax=Gracilibacillus halophilus YIM-C55.5 TaxID=1308866 RepID=N4W8J7_9BACI|nr:IscS subfamily cysteine desulfurase [Gracilibacillus halophilus]ENH96588.1 cysteine desulfurase [Gracilibacillus halophilus YIM-C55.5]